MLVLTNQEKKNKFNVFVLFFLFGGIKSAMLVGKLCTVSSKRKIQLSRTNFLPGCQLTLF